MITLCKLLLNKAVSVSVSYIFLLITVSFTSEWDNSACCEVKRLICIGQ